MKKRAVIAAYTCFLLFFFITVFATLYSIYGIRENSDSDSETYLTEIAALCAQIVEKQIQKDFDLLKIYADYFKGVTANSSEDYISFFSKVSHGDNFKRMGIVFPDGRAFTSDNNVLNLSDRDFFNDAILGNTVISSVLTDLIDGQLIVVFAVPVGTNGRVESVFYAVQNVNAYAKLIGINPLAGRGESFIINNDGRFISISSRYEQYYESFFQKNIFDILNTIEIAEKEYLQFISSITNRLGGIISFKTGGIKMKMSYAPVPSRNWMLLTVFESDLIAKNTNALVLRNTIIGGLLVLGIFISIMVLFWRENANKREIEQIAFVDPITGYSNWEKFRRDAAKLLTNTHLRYAVISFETQSFRMYNEIYGHDKADIFLRKIADCIAFSCRQNETFARVSADNFVVLISYDYISGVQSYISSLSDKIHETDEANMTSCHFGVCLVPDASTPVNECYDKATAAKMLARQNKYDPVAFYDEKTHRKVREESELEAVMEDALKNGEFIMYLQPKIGMHNTKVIGAEALVRWNHKNRGLIQPGVFLPLFERNGFITQIDYEICRQACALLKSWIDAEKEPIPISVNFSRLHLHKNDFISNVNKIVDYYEVPHKYIEIEITETIAESFENANFLKDMILDFRKQGYLVAMDDFGSGYSSLNMLAKLPVNVLKMDKRFFDHDLFGSENKSARSIISGVIEIAKDLDMVVVAEGIESQEQYDLLCLMKCDMIQGFYFSPPLPVDRFEHFVFVCNKFWAISL